MHESVPSLKFEHLANKNSNTHKELVINKKIDLNQGLKTFIPCLIKNPSKQDLVSSRRKLLELFWRQSCPFQNDYHLNKGNNEMKNYILFMRVHSSMRM